MSLDIREPRGPHDEEPDMFARVTKIGTVTGLFVGTENRLTGPAWAWSPVTKSRLCLRSASFRRTDKWKAFSWRSERPIRDQTGPDVSWLTGAQQWESIYDAKAAWFSSKYNIFWAAVYNIWRTGDTGRPVRGDSPVIGFQNVVARRHSMVAFSTSF